MIFECESLKYFKRNILERQTSVQGDVKVSKVVLEYFKSGILRRQRFPRLSNYKVFLDIFHPKNCELQLFQLRT